MNPSASQKSSIAFICVGSNLGDKLANCRRGLAALTADKTSSICARSKIYRTAPVDDTDQDWFINYVVALATTLEPLELLEAITRVEVRAGRIRTGRKYGPRTLDLDIILFGDRIVDLPQLRVPHPRMHKRRFVLKPLCDINPQIVHPVLKKTMGQLLADLSETDQQVIEIP
jgi:2-amino-4-hydroxy-6-hydroxymethyldihydropteridine diphosphokinase